MLTLKEIEEAREIIYNFTTVTDKYNKLSILIKNISKEQKLLVENIKKYRRR